MKIYGNKDGKLKAVERKESELQKKIYEDEENKIREPWFKFWGKVFLIGYFLWLAIFKLGPIILEKLS
jgi:hypothetical protein|tara:strand:+ start:280 stop:483 length:204 start_codon:yes stop_codon:yes gene_type:complete